MSFKKTELVMLPTNEKANLLLTGRNDLYYSSKLSDFSLKEYIDRFQHLYFLSDEEIKEGDYFIYPELKEKDIWLCRGSIPNVGAKKIIATTDKSLIIPYDGKTPISENWEGYKLPQPSQSFIEKFVDEYNKGNVITEVMVEYETITKRYGSCSIGEGVTMNVEQLKVSKDNTITIRKVKESWNRDEVVELLSKHFVDAGSKIGLGQDVTKFTKKWIQENL